VRRRVRLFASRQTTARRAVMHGCVAPRARNAPPPPPPVRAAPPSAAPCAPSPPPGGRRGAGGGAPRQF
jgi:hypothetical protein